MLTTVPSYHFRLIYIAERLKNLIFVCHAAAHGQWRCQRLRGGGCRHTSSPRRDHELEARAGPLAPDRVAVLDLSKTGGSVAGLLGSDELRHFGDVTIDFPQQQLWLAKP